MKTLILISLICLSSCCDSPTILSKFKLTLAQGQDSAGNSALALGLSYFITSSVVSGATAYQVTIRYVDDINNQLLGDRVNCIDFRIYSTYNATIDPTRRFITTPILDLGQTPSWPISSYYYNQLSNTGSITFNMSQANLQNNCLNPTGAPYVLGQASSIQYNCYFELAYLVANVTQASYYFGTIVTINTSVSGSTTQAATVLKLVQSPYCTTLPCSIAVTVNSTLAFCQDQTCAVTAAIPFVTLFVNSQFYMKHQITDAAFTTGYTLQAPQMVFQSVPLFQLYTPTIGLFPVYKGNYNIYQVTVPIASQGVLMTATATLTLDTALASGSNLLASFYFGKIVTIKTSVSGSTTQGVNILRSPQSTPCTTSPCSIAVTINSTLAFCKDSTCAVTAATPFVTLFVNSQFYIKHQISDAEFITGYTLQAPSMTFQDVRQLNFFVPTPGLFPVYEGNYNIYQVTVPFVSQGVLMTATATLTSSTALASGSQIYTVAGGGQTTTTQLKMGPSRKASDRTKCLTYKSKSKTAAKAKAFLCKTNSTGQKCINATALAAKTSKLAISSCAGMTFASN